jgi:hypothetical protein
MRFRGFLSALLILSVLAVSAATSSAQQPAPATAFDGKYVGTATSTYAHDVAFCIVIRSIGMTITGGQVRIHELLPSGGGLTGVASTQREKYRRPANQQDTLLPSREPSMIMYSQVSAWMEHDGVANTASKWPQHPRQRRRSTVGTEAYPARCQTAGAMSITVIR